MENLTEIQRKNKFNREIEKLIKEKKDKGKEGEKNTKFT